MKKDKFEINLLTVSNNTVHLDKSEWRIICDNKVLKQDGLCICQTKVNKIKYLYNIKNYNTIMVAQTCFTNFGMPNIILENDKLRELLSAELLNHKYTINNNIIKYNNVLCCKMDCLACSVFDEYKEHGFLEQLYLLLKDTSQLDISQINTSQINTSQINISQLNSDASLL